jgi:hypothetical protein
MTQTQRKPLTLTKWLGVGTGAHGVARAAGCDDLGPAPPRAAVQSFRRCPARLAHWGRTSRPAGARECGSLSDATRRRGSARDDRFENAAPGSGPPYGARCSPCDDREPEWPQRRVTGCGARPDGRITMQIGLGGRPYDHGGRWEQHGSPPWELKQSECIPPVSSSAFG